MTAELPAPQSLWREITSGLIFTVAMAEPSEVSAVNERGVWLGSPERFAKEFEEVTAE